MILVNTHNGQRIIPVIGSLLESLQHANIQVESECKNGYCGQCKVRLDQGKVEYFNSPICVSLKNEILPCSCKPSTPLIEISL